VGNLLPELVHKLGFVNTPVIATGGHDQACGALGVGLIDPWLCMDSTGTAEVIEVALPTPALTPELEKTDISVYAHVVPDMYLAMTLNHGGGMSLRWFRDQFCQQEIAEAKRSGMDPYDLIFKDASADPSSLFLMPHFSGSGTPKFDTRSRAVLAGMTFGTTRLEIARAVLEGVTFELRHNLEVLLHSNIKIEEMRALGGGARSKYWLQLKADITGIPVVVPRITEAASWGAGILGGIAAGHFNSARQALSTSLEFVRRFEPDPQRHQAFTERYNLYREIYLAMQSILHRMA
jgi:xylulokinase